VLSANASPSFSYSIGGPAPPSQVVPVTVIPSTLAVAVTPVVNTPEGGNWLAALLDHGSLYVVVNPLGLVASPPLNPYVGYVTLLAQDLNEVQVPVSLTVYPQTALSIALSHTGDFVQGEQGATYYIVVSSASAGPTSGMVTVTENPPTGESIVSMAGGSVWTCGASSCTTTKSIAAGASYPPIAVSIIVASNASSPLTNIATVSGGGSSTSPSASDITTVVPLTCTFTGAPTATVADVQMLINEALGLYPAAYDLNGDGSVNVVDLQIAMGTVLNGACIE